MSKRVALLKGGWSPEREVSLTSGRACADALREAGYDVVEIDVTRDLRALVDALRPLAGGGPDVVFNALHGRWGEDGCIQGVLEILAIPYTHSGVLASSLAMDKEMSRKVYASTGLRCAEGMVSERRALLAGDPMPRPYVVKPVDQGSSIGVHINFFAPDDFDPEILPVAAMTGQPVSIGELLTVGGPTVVKSQYAGRVLIITGEHDIPFCGGDCKATGVINGTAPDLLQASKPMFPKASSFKTVMVEGAGHGLNYQYTHVSTYKSILDFFGSS